ncbi:MAG: hypothetical protein ACLFV6_03270 [Spirulinaceae cyanobacterium]
MNIESTPMNAVDNSSWYPINPEHEQDCQDNAGLEDEVNKEVSAPDSCVDAEADDHLDTDLPEPDRDNITVLTNKLPNKPILPWNRYDSPWSEEEEKARQKQAETEAEAPSTEESKTIDIEEDEVE